MTLLEGKNEINALCDNVHTVNFKWWVDLNTGELLKRNVPEMLMLVVSEIAEAMEGQESRLSPGGKKY